MSKKLKFMLAAVLMGSMFVVGSAGAASPIKDDGTITCPENDDNTVQTGK